MNRRKLIAAGALLISTLAIRPAEAQSGVTRIIVAFAPGGPVDTVARVIAEQLGKELGQSVIVENKPGANGALGANEVKRAPPDGRTLWLTSVGAAAINEALSPNTPYVMDTDFQPISVIVNNVELLVVNKQNPVTNATEFVAATKVAREPTPMASSGVGSIPHLAIEQFADATGARLQHVPYRGAAPAINDVAGGHVAAFFGDVAGLIGHIGPTGALKPIGLAATRRHPLLPDVLTLEEQGMKGIDTNNWYALYGPAKIPADTLAALSKAVRATLEHKPTADKLLSLGAEPAPSTPDELAVLRRMDAEKWAKLIRAKNIKAE